MCDRSTSDNGQTLKVTPVQVERGNRHADRSDRGVAIVAACISQMNMQPATSTPEEFAQIVQSEIDRWGPLIKKLGITLD